MSLRYATVCSGIEAPTVAIRGLGTGGGNPLDWGPVFFAEIAEFPSRVLAHHFPEVPNRGDFTKIESADRVDVLIGGTPCQDFSIAGSRAGMDGANGQLAIEYVRLLARLAPRWFVWENVDGCLSSNDGRDFGAFLRALGDCGYHLAWRVLDSQFFGVPQRRRRVFVVGYLGDWRPPAAVLFERESLRRNPAEKRRAKRDAPAAAAASLGGDRQVGTIGGRRGMTAETVGGGQYAIGTSGGAARALTSHHCHRYDARTETFVVRMNDRQTALNDVSDTLRWSRRRGPTQAVIGGSFDALSLAENQRGEVVTSDVSPALSSGGGKPGQGYAAVLTRRRL